MASVERRLKNAMYGQLARVAKALSSPHRLELLEILAQHPRTVEDLASRLGQKLSTTSHHLQKLREARLVEAEREGQFVRYRVADPVVFDLLGTLRATAEAQLAEIEQITSELLGDVGPLTELSRAELLRGVEHHEVVLLDVRPREEFEAGHLQGATNIPLAELPHRLAELGDGDVVAYCRGPCCLLAADAVRVLEASGRTAHRLDDGVVDWRAAGMPVTSRPAQDS
jgi:DNA-binding transcriptional ArsR family regulator